MSTIDPLAIRREMAALGWSSEDRLSDIGCAPGTFAYSIWFWRWDWHGRRTDRATYHAHALSLAEAPAAVKEAADRALAAWSAHPAAPPDQLADGTLRRRVTT